MTMQYRYRDDWLHGNQYKYLIHIFLTLHSLLWHCFQLKVVKISSKPAGKYHFHALWIDNWVYLSICTHLRIGIALKKKTDCDYKCKKKCFCPTANLLLNLISNEYKKILAKSITVFLSITLIYSFLLSITYSNKMNRHCCTCFKTSAHRFLLLYFISYCRYMYMNHYME